MLGEGKNCENGGVTGEEESNTVIEKGGSKYLCVDKWMQKLMKELGQEGPHADIERNITTWVHPTHGTRVWCQCCLVRESKRWLISGLYMNC